MSCLKRQYHLFMLVLGINHLTCIGLCFSRRVCDLCYPCIHYFLTNDNLSVIINILLKNTKSHMKT